MNQLPRGLLPAVAGAATLGAVSTLGDWIWARYLRDGDPVAGCFCLTTGAR